MTEQEVPPEVSLTENNTAISESSTHEENVEEQSANLSSESKNLLRTLQMQTECHLN